MAKDSKIEWTEHTVNLWWGCAKVHTGCKNCYAETLSHRFGEDIWGEKTHRKRIKSAFSDLDKYQRTAKLEGRKDRVFIGSMMDIFEESKLILNPTGGITHTENLRNMLFQKIIEGRFPNLIFLFLTKRPENISLLLPTPWHGMIPPNVWFGTSLSNQETANEYVKKLSDNIINIFPAKLFLSVEPQVDIIDNLDLSEISWVIQGGESGHGNRPFDINWAYKMRDICKEQHTPFFFKQIDKIKEIPEDLLIRELPNF